MSSPETGYEAYHDYLKSLHDAGLDYFVEGGQAVKMCSKSVCRRAMDHLGICGESLIPWKKMQECSSELLSRFADSQPKDA